MEQDWPAIQEALALDESLCVRQGGLRPQCRSAIDYAAPIGAFLCPEIRAFTGFGVRFLRQSLVTIKYCLHPKNGR